MLLIATKVGKELFLSCKLSCKPMDMCAGSYEISRIESCKHSPACRRRLSTEIYVADEIF